MYWKLLLASRRLFHRAPWTAQFQGGLEWYGDADPSNTSPLVRGAEMRVAETRAVNRALRKAYGIGLCSVEELGWLNGSPGPAREGNQSLKPPHQGILQVKKPKLGKSFLDSAGIDYQTAADSRTTPASPLSRAIYWS